MSKQGKFITFEGGEGVGKSTQIKLLHNHLQHQGLDVVITREPGGTIVAESIRDMLVTGAANKWDAESELLLINLARRDHIMKVIKPALSSGCWVLCDRFIDSTYAYQGLAQSVSLGLIQLLHKNFCDNLWPDCTFILDMDPCASLIRANARDPHSNENRYEQMDLKFHQGVRNAFLDIASQHPSRCHLIDCSQAVEDDCSQAVEDVFASLQYVISEKLCNAVVQC